MDLRERRELYNGFGDTLARAVEFVAAPGLFAYGGHLLDARFGTGNLLTVVLAVFAMAGVFVRAYFAYEVAMRQHEAECPWAGPSPVRRDAA
ncbi:MAG TPA: AtpZ/AtpI family protein [Acidimicrobiales bacterium]|nr:AtpZ/AtpI family protein [Acidimicrobiales bacterium]